MCKSRSSERRVSARNLVSVYHGPESNAGRRPLQQCRRLTFVEVLNHRDNPGSSSSERLPTHHLPVSGRSVQIDPDEFDESFSGSFRRMDKAGQGRSTPVGYVSPSGSPTASASASSAISSSSRRASFSSTSFSAARSILRRKCAASPKQSDS